MRCCRPVTRRQRQILCRALSWPKQFFLFWMHCCHRVARRGRKKEIEPLLIKSFFSFCMHCCRSVARRRRKARVEPVLTQSVLYIVSLHFCRLVTRKQRQQYFRACSDPINVFRFVLLPSCYSEADTALVNVLRIVSTLLPSCYLDARDKIVTCVFVSRELFIAKVFWPLRKEHRDKTRLCGNTG